MKEYIVYVMSVNGEWLLFDSPNQLLQKEPYTIYREAREIPTPGYYWGYLDSSGKTQPTTIPFSWIIPDELISLIGIQLGDQIKYCVPDAGDLVVIKEINGQPVKKLTPISQLQADYPSQPLAIDSFGFPNLRVANGQAPFGYGTCGYIQGPGGSGKTSLQLEFAEACFRLSEQLPLFVVVIQLGERSKDAALYKEVLSNSPHSDEHVEIYVAPVGIVETINQWYLFEYIIQRARALARFYHVVLLIDSLHRAVAAHSMAGLADKNGGMFSGGFYVESLLKATEMVSVTGSFKTTSLTIASVLLGNYDRGDVKGAPLAQISAQTSDNVPDLIWSLVLNPSISYPRLDVDPSRTLSRRVSSFMPPTFQPEWNAVDSLKWQRDPTSGRATNKAEQAHRLMVEYYLNNPIPPWAEFPPADGKALIPIHLQMMGIGNPVPDQLAMLVDKELSAKINHFAQTRGIPADVLMANATDLYTRLLEAEGKGQKVFIGPKSGDLTAQITLTPQVNLNKL